MTREDAQVILVSKGYSTDEAAKILAVADADGSALTAPRDCPSLWVTVRSAGGSSYRVQENDSGRDYTPASM